MWKNFENFSKSIQILVSESEVWTCNLMITSLVSYPLDHRGKLENSADYVSFIQQTPKYALLAHKMYNVQTHFGFTTLGSKLNTFWVLGNWKVKKVSGTPCNVLNNAGKVWSKFYLTQFTKNYHLAIFRDNFWSAKIGW